MANKLAGQRAKFTNAFREYHRTDDEAARGRAALRMAEVLRDAPVNGFAEEQVSQSVDVPEAVRRLQPGVEPSLTADDEEAGQEIAALHGAVDGSGARVIGEGTAAVYAYTYACTPDRLKIGQTGGDVLDRIAKQINTSTPDRPLLKLVIRTGQAVHIERMLHAALRAKGAEIAGGGTEWFRITPDELLALYEAFAEAIDL